MLFALLPAACSRPAATSVPEEGKSYFQVSDRLSNQRVNAFAEDADGHIWIGTFRGLDKYTIHDYHQYFSIADTLGLPDNQITALCCSASGRLWVGTPFGAAVRMEDGSFRQVPILGDSREISQIQESRDGRMLFNTSGMLLSYDEAADCIRPVVSDFGGYQSVIGQDGRIWTVDGDGVRLYNF